MAFTVKLTDMLKDACDVARADDASLFAFILKNEGRDVRTFAANTSVEIMMCILATVMQGLEDVAGLSRKEVIKILDKTMKECGPITSKEAND